MIGNNCVLGIDPGFDGGLVWVGPGNVIIRSAKMPVVKLDKGRALLCRETFDLISSMPVASIWIEDVPDGWSDDETYEDAARERPYLKSRSSSMKLARQHGQLLMATELATREYETVTARMWQATFGIIAGDHEGTKAQAEAVCRDLFADQFDELLTRPKGGYDDGLGDAALIATFGHLYQFSPDKVDTSDDLW